MAFVGFLLDYAASMSASPYGNPEFHCSVHLSKDGGQSTARPCNIGRLMPTWICRANILSLQNIKQPQNI